MTSGASLGPAVAAVKRPAGVAIVSSVMWCGAAATVSSLPICWFCRRLRLFDLRSPGGELRESRGPQGGGERHVDGVAAAGHEHAADARCVVPCIERVPAVAQISLEPGGGVLGGRV